ncbi:MAG TPA: thioredoxin-disulfide reductase [Candidatus Magasanikbacteria bacterium]|nr:thioredoxin-disulfide reductase [Candidatus Magasanikbacteria bacterium]
MKDLIIIGASAAGMSAAIYAGRNNLDFLIVSKDIGGEVALSGKVGNWPGTITTTGVELAKNFHDHVKSIHIQIDDGFEVTEIKQVKNYHIVMAKNYAGEERQYETKAVIIASGIHPRHLGIPGDKEFYGKGITYCTTCDGPLFKNKITATVGAGNSALESVLTMTKIAQKVYLLTRYNDDHENNGGFPKGERILIDKVKALENVEIIYNADTQEIIGDQMVTGLKYTDLNTKENKQIDLNGVMIHIGMTPNSDFVNCVDKSPMGEIKVDLKCATNCPGLFAAGDVTNIPFKQIVIAAGHGVTAALSAIGYINRWKELT